MRIGGGSDTPCVDIRHTHAATCSTHACTADQTRGQSLGGGRSVLMTVNILHLKFIVLKAAPAEAARPGASPLEPSNPA